MGFEEEPDGNPALLDAFVRVLGRSDVVEHLAQLGKPPRRLVVVGVKLQHFAQRRVRAFQGRGRLCLPAQGRSTEQPGIWDLATSLIETTEAEHRLADDTPCLRGQLDDRRKRLGYVRPVVVVLPESPVVTTDRYELADGTEVESGYVHLSSIERPT